MELRYLRYFVAVAEELHFGRAAKRLYMTQPALSKQIRRLENELELQLLHRTKRTVELTAAGKAFLPEARRILQQAEEAVQVAKRAARGEVGHLRIAFTASAMHSVLPEILKNFRDRYPKVKLDLTEFCTLDMVEVLRVEKADLGFLHPPVDAPFLKLQPMPGENLVVALSQNHPLVERESLPLAALANEPFILHPRYEGPVLYDQIVNLCKQAGFEPRVVHEEVKNQTRVGLVAAGLGITFVPQSLQNAGLSGVVYRPLSGSAPELQLAVAWRGDRVSPVLQGFLQIVQQLSVEGNAPMDDSLEKLASNTAY